MMHNVTRNRSRQIYVCFVVIAYWVLVGFAFQRHVVFHPPHHKTEITFRVNWSILQDELLAKQPKPQTVAITPVRVIENISSYWPQSIQQWNDEITTVADEWKVDVNLIAAIMDIESGGQQFAVSPVGAMGLLQVMPFHPCSTFSAQENIECGVSILAAYYHLENDNWFKALQAYNAGPYNMQAGYNYATDVMQLWKNSEGN